MTYRKVGGLHFITIGPLGLVLYLNREACTTIASRFTKVVRAMQERMAGLHVWWLTQAQNWGRILVL